jgi:hypothetical protein
MGGGKETLVEGSYVVVFSLCGSYIYRSLTARCFSQFSLRLFYLNGLFHRQIREGVDMYLYSIRSVLALRDLTLTRISGSRLGL